jgi:hypothetical protein
MERRVVNEHPVRPESLGAHYGFRRNPYDPSPLEIDSEDAALFVGREREATTFRAFLDSFDRGAIVVEGGVGVGKTSFVNVQEYRAGAGHRPPALLPTRQPLQLASTLSPVEFLLSVESNVLSSLQRAVPAVAKETSFRRLSLAVTQSVVKSRGWEAYAAGFGGGISQEVSVSNPLLALLPSISEQLDDAAALAKSYGIGRLVINVNNLDVIGPQTLVTFLDLTRDLTLTRAPFLWAFLGPIGVRVLIAQRTRRVSELIRTDPVWLPPLSLSEVQAAIQARVRRFRIETETPPPVAPDVVRWLYATSAGEVRYILNRCTDLLLKTMAEFPTAGQVSRELAAPMLKRMTTEALDRFNLSPKQRSVLSNVARNGPCQPREHLRFGFASAPAFLRYLTRFYQLGLVDRRRRESSVVYTPRGDVVLALGADGARGSDERSERASP